MRFFSTAILTVLGMLAAILSLPVTSYAFGSDPPLSYASAPGQGTCASCHGTLTAGSGITVNAPTSYTPGGAAVPMTVTIPASGGFELEVATQISNVQAGVLAAADANGAVMTFGGMQFAYSSRETTSWTFSWTPPTTNVGSVVLYVAGGGQGTNYSRNFVMTTGAVAPSITSFTAGAATITAGKSTTLTAMFTGGTGTISGVTGTVTSGTAVTVTPSATTTYTLTDTPTTGTAVTKTVAVAVVPAPVITSFTAGATTLTAMFTGGTGTISGVTGTVTSGTAVTVTPSVTTSYTLTVTNAATTPATATATATVTVTPSLGPIITSFAAGAGSITAGNSTTLTAVFSNGTGTVNNGVGTVTSGTPVTIIPSVTTTYTLTVAGTSTSVNAQATVTVNPTTGTGTLTSTPSSLSFSYQMGGRLPYSRTLSITSTGGSTPYTAQETDPWLSISPTSGTGTPASIRVSVNLTGMAAGSYGGQINITSQNGKTITVPVALIITSSSGGGGTTGGMFAQPYMSDTQSGTLAAAWVDNMGASPLSTTDLHNRGLVLAKSASASATAWAGASIQNVTGMSLTELGFDFRASIQCSTNSLQFVVVTTDGVRHTVGACSSSSTTPASSAPTGWTRLRFDPRQASPAINSPVESISLELDKGSTSTGSIAVIDNIEVNGVPVAKVATSTLRDE
jgi:hypothetical protein